MSLVELSKDEIETMKVVDLKKHLKDLKLATTGTKPELQKRLTDALMASKQAKTDPKNNNNNNNKKPPPSSSANKSSENNNSSSAATTANAAVVGTTAESNTNTQEKNTNADASVKTEEKKNSEVDEKNQEQESNNDSIDNTGNDDTTSTTNTTAQKKLSNTKRIEVEGLPEELLVWDVEDSTKKTNGISRNLGVTTAEFMLQRQERIKKYGMKAMPEQVKRMMRKQRFLSGSSNGDTNKPQSKDENKGDDDTTTTAATTSNDPTNRSDFSIQSLLASDGASDGLTREKLSQRKKRFGHAAIESAFQQSMQTGFENRQNRNRNNQNRNNQNRNNQNRNNQNNQNNQNRNNQNRNRNNNNNNNNNNNVATTTNQFRNINRNRDRNMAMDDKIKARMERFGTKPPREDGNRRGFDRDWHRMDRNRERDRDRRRPQDRHHSARRNNRDRSRSRQRNRDDEIESFDEEAENVVESTIHTATKSGGIIKDFGSDDDMGLSAEDMERIEQRKKRFEA